MQKVYTIEVRLNLPHGKAAYMHADSTMVAAVRAAANHVNAASILLHHDDPEFPSRPIVVCFSDDFFTGHHGIENPLEGYWYEV